MKRSDMKTQLVQLLVLCKNNDVDYARTAEEVLSLVESRGMVPPYREVEPNVKYLDNIDEVSVRQGAAYHRSWEPEYEKK